MNLNNSLRVEATLVSNDFIDIYMASASGEYVKEYLFLLRHQEEEITVSMIADALNHTESDVNRALSYWKRAGVLREGQGPTAGDGKTEAAGGKIGTSNPEDVFSAAKGIKKAASSELACAGGVQPEPLASLSRRESEKEEGNGAVRIENGMDGTVGNTPSVLPFAKSREADGRKEKAGDGQEGAGKKDRPPYPPERIGTLAGDEDFSQLLYIAQKYMNKVFTQMECEVFAYLYDGLRMAAELLEYVVEYCVQSGHTSIRYIETVAINWYESGIKTVEEAKTHASSFTRDSFAVMKAFGLNDRKPGDSEWEMIERWFKSYGFTRELVLEACNRTIAATHSPSFKYADKILSGWKKAKAHTLKDVKRLDQEHEGRAGGKSGAAPAAKSSGGGRGKNSNQFQNFPQRDIDYDALVLKQLTES